MPATVALHKCGLSPVTFFSEIANDPIEVAKAHWPEAISIGDMRTLNMEWIDGVVSTCPDALIWITGGIPCKDVSKLNKNRNGASGQHSGLYLEAKKIFEYVRSKTDNVIFSFECTRMDDSDKKTFSEAFGVEPVEIDNRGFAPLSRPRWWWIGGKQPTWPKDSEIKVTNGITRIRPKSPAVSWEDCLLPGYSPCSISTGRDTCFNCLTTRTKRTGPMPNPAGLESASQKAKARWIEDNWSQAPYNFEDMNMVQDENGSQRRLHPCEEEQLMGYPRDYTAVLKKSQDEKHLGMSYRRQTLLGNSWSIFVTIFIIKALVIPNIASGQRQLDSIFEDLEPEAFKWGSANCPYILDLQERSLDEGQPLPPDLSEMNAHTFGGLAEKVQARKHTPWHLRRAVTTGGIVASLPKGLPPDIHFHSGRLADSPADETPVIPDDLDFAVRTTIALGATANAWRQDQIKALKSWLHHADDLQQVWEDLRSETAKEVAPKVSPAALDLLAQ